MKAAAQPKEAWGRRLQDAQQGLCIALEPSQAIRMRRKSASQKVQVGKQTSLLQGELAGGCTHVLSCTAMRPRSGSASAWQAGDMRSQRLASTL